MRTVSILFLTCCIFMLSSITGSKAGIIVETANSALQRNMFAPSDLGSSSPVQKSSSSKANSSNYDEGEFGKAAAQKLFNNQTPLVLVDIDNPQTSVKLYKGQFLAVRMVEPDNTQWNFENTSSGLQFVKKEKRNGVLILLYRSVNSNSGVLHFDLMNDGTALFSRILNVRVI